MGLDEASLGLRLEQAEDLFLGAHLHVQPGRDRADRRQRHGVAQQHADDRCIHVVPHLDGVVMITSSGRSWKRSQRALSAMKPVVVDAFGAMVGASGCNG